MDLELATIVAGLALVIDDTQTILIEPSYRAYILSGHVLLEREAKDNLPPDLIPKKPVSVLSTFLDPIRLSVFTHWFMAIAEQMGNMLQRTSISTA
ncbi:hypothetical protein B0J13DRAFT_572196 [Dactylonectria estremocensis]|uniref:Hydantoinase B/oxoprolinase domain-containing protein n=1 Tax=Dactylonectria estremocensis TaxID=1079267 RepID=A0A9P9DAP2_9HYPO|nr:hypothetical protein B0J13DRAFT_572196 [Dactylonectria estremocensis]